MGALKDVYEGVFDLAITANLPTEGAKLRRKLEQLEQEHEREVQHLKQQIKDLKAIVQLAPPRLSSAKPAEPASERIDKGNLSLDAQGW
jgi:hypothetical protein